jgi:hypothetical protein
VPRDVIRTIRGIQDVEQLMALQVVALQSGSLAVFRERLKEVLEIAQQQEPPSNAQS